MSTTSILRASHRASLKPVNSKKSILKRSASIALSPLLLALPFTSSPAINSPSSPFQSSPRSPHVHFPPTPSLASTFITHSASTYDRTPVDLPPNPLEFPPRGRRAYDSSFADSLSQGIVPVDIPAAAFDPPMSDSDVPLSASIMSPPPVFHRFIRFATLPPHSPLPNLQSQTSAEIDNGHSVGSPYPRSPYPAAPSPPLTPTEADTAEGSHANDAKPVMKKKPRRIVAWKGHGELRISDLLASPSISSPLRQTHMTPGAEAPPTKTSGLKSPAGTKPQPLDLNPSPGSDSDGSNPSSQLSKAFWRSVSLVDVSDEAACISACAYPPSAVGIQEFLAEDIDSPATSATQTRHTPGLLSLLSPVPLSAAPLSAVPDLVMGRKPEMLWSPGLPRKRPSLKLKLPEAAPAETGIALHDAHEDQGEDQEDETYIKYDYMDNVDDADMVDLTSILSPDARKEARFLLNPPPRSTVAAPSPNDPFAAFPSFSAVLELHGGVEGTHDTGDFGGTGHSRRGQRDVELD
ncbi:hypothetical protein CCMSSC00406_0009315 [Pleurotus cornucopiae]|uniref:Uncharacterized protein n=1 Tax=Pleurotus cornucopiae TaxID=5321 RepID=A0ACB7IV40_PLECO|nr:hypothetical protein CCMSSC00406_0009315 [Pleurotus cornucopiae]